MAWLQRRRWHRRVLQLAMLLCWAQCGQTDTGDEFPDQLLYKLFYKEPNAHLHLLGNVSDSYGSLTRTFLSSGHRRAASLLQRWMSEAGMTAWVDSIGNVHGRVESKNDDAPTQFIGSHYDTVVDGGKYDGALGIIVGISAVKALLLDAALKQSVITPADLEGVQTADIDVRSLLGQKRFSLLSSPVEVVAFSDEEGVRFQSTYLGSRALTGTLLETGLLDNRDANGITVVQAIEAFGVDGSAAAIQKIAVPRERMKGYVEVHMEQGPVLQSANQAVGPVTAIAGQTRLQAMIFGEQGHAGTVPMHIRHDPLAAAAEVIAELEKICNGGFYSTEPFNKEVADDESLVCTVGSVTVWPNAGNVIAGSANFTMDIRSRWDANRRTIIKAVRASLDRVCRRRGLTCDIETKNEAAAVECNQEVVQGLVKSTEAAAPIIERVLHQQEAYQRQLQQAMAAMQGACAALPDAASLPACQGLLGPAGQQNGSRATATAAAASTASHTFAAAVKDGKNGSATGGGKASSGSSSGSAAGGKRLPLLVSGAGHDAMVMAQATKMGMLFVRCKDGISHSPLEHVDEEDVSASVVALYKYLQHVLYEP